jgi:hypothetical protein
LLHCIDRIYANFAIEAEVTVTTFYHLDSDHRGVLYSWSAWAPLMEEPPLPPLHRAFELKEVTAYNRAILQDYAENHLKGPQLLPQVGQG